MNKEFITSEEEKRYVIFPIRHEEFWGMYKKAEANFWTTEELDLSKDMNDYNKLSDNEKYFINSTFTIICICKCPNFRAYIQYEGYAWSCAFCIELIH